MIDNQKLKEILEKVDSSKEILSTMPKNNEKNINIYREKAKELEKEYTKYKKQIKEILEKRYKAKVDFEENKEISELNSRINTIENVKYILEDEKSSIAKIGLDRNIYKISRFYKANLDSVNSQIAEAIEKFCKVNIKLNISDFDYSEYVQEYMQTFFKEMSKHTLDSGVLKAKFEEVYWKCPDIIIHIELNLRNIYLKYQVDIDKYFAKKKVELLKKWKKTPSEIENSYLEIKKRLIEESQTDKKTLINMFLSGKLNIKEFTDNKLRENYQKLLPEETNQNIENIVKFFNSLCEYKNYLEFKFLVSDIKKIYEEKEKYKKANTETKKELQNLEKKFKKLNKKLNSKGFFSKKTKGIKQSPEMNALINTIKNKYKELEFNEFYNKIATQVNDHSTIFEVLKLATSDYVYLTDSIIRNDNSISEEDIEEKINKLNRFLGNPYITAINNISFMEEKDIALVIKDRYKLLNFKIEKEDLKEDQIDNLISIVKNIIIGINIRKAKLEVKDIEEICVLNKLLY